MTLPKIFKRRKHRDAPQPKAEHDVIDPRTRQADAPGGCTSAPPQSYSPVADLALIEKLEKLKAIKRDASQRLLDEAIELGHAINLMRRALRMAEKH